MTPSFGKKITFQESYKYKNFGTNLITLRRANEIEEMFDEDFIHRKCRYGGSTVLGNNGEDMCELFVHNA